MPVFSEEAEGSGAELHHPQFCLRVCGGEHNDCLDYCLALQLHHREEKQTPQWAVKTARRAIGCTIPLRHLHQQMQRQSN